MENQMFGFSNIYQMGKTSAYPCPSCGSKSVEVYSTNDPIGPTGIYRCLNDDCDTYHVPSMPEVKP